MPDIRALHERAKELRCLYAVDAIVSDRGQTPGKAFLGVLQEIPAGWQDPASTGARIVYLGRSYVGPGFAADGNVISEPIYLWGVELGQLTVSDCSEAAAQGEQQFLPEESELLHRVAARLGEYLEWKHTELLGERTSATRSHWAWRQRFAEALADSLDPERFGVSRIFIGGSTARGDAGPASDIDLYVDCGGTDEQKRELQLWLDGWSRCLGEVAHQQTGQPFPEGILNVQWMTGELSVAQRAELQELELNDRGQKGRSGV
jgi:hypothetical protein